MEYSSTECVNEECWPLVGERRGRLWCARRWTRSVGSPAEVGFDAAGVLEREADHGDVIGFLHTHPHTPAQPSRRDVDTMRAWASCFGKPLLCVIAGTDGTAAFRFSDDASVGERLTGVDLLRCGTVVAIEHDGSD